MRRAQFLAYSLSPDTQKVHHTQHTPGSLPSPKIKNKYNYYNLNKKLLSHTQRQGKVDPQHAGRLDNHINVSPDMRNCGYVLSRALTGMSNATNGKVRLTVCTTVPFVYLTAWAMALGMQDGQAISEDFHVLSFDSSSFSHCR
jgi:hypothetical protein